eukprot:gb/GFBE01010485.1/.p1 GENE.gb/GFBE01010485.1/~~gb/GFBE01010485.1/.p1  ORF type:complete len:195 (+),score=43.76 gb/GFBE01010485.1/:1-585(+)
MPMPSSAWLLLAVLLQPGVAGPAVTDEVIAARKWTTWAGPGGKTAEAGPAEQKPVVNGGDVIFFRAYHGKHLDVQNNKIRARFKQQGARQAFSVDKRSAGPIRPGDRIFVTGSNGMRLEVNGEEVSAVSEMRGPRQEFVIERMSGGTDPIAVGDTIFLQAHTGKHIDVVGDVVKARFARQGFGYHALVVEKPSR